MVCAKKLQYNKFSGDGWKNVISCGSMDVPWMTRMTNVFGEAGRFGGVEVRVLNSGSSLWFYALCSSSLWWRCITIVPTPRGVSSHAPLLLCPEGIIPRVGRTCISITLTYGQRLFSLSLKMHSSHVSPLIARGFSCERSPPQPKAIW